MDLVLKVTHYDLTQNPDTYAEMPNVTSVKRTHFLEHPDGRQDIEYTYCAHGQIPPIAQKIISPKMLTWRELGRWDPARRVYTFEIIPFFLQHLFHCKGVWTYEEKDGRIIQIMEGKLSLKIPIVGGIVEQAIATEMYKNQDQGYQTHLVKLAKLV
ncbi:MAG TPA: hypothetical protein PLQ76_00925 [bacterium]|nr:hypothetical protein [bacterium]